MVGVVDLAVLACVLRATTKKGHQLFDEKVHSGKILTMPMATTTESIGILKCKVLEHYSSVCAAREVTY